MKKDYKLILIIGVLLAISLIIGTSYAYWMITHTQANKNIAGTGCFTTTFTESNDINLTNQFPISDTDGAKLTPYTFTITNTCTIAANYQVNMEVLNTTTADLAYIKTELNNDTPVILNTYSTVDKTIDTATSSYKMTTGYLGASESVTYNLRIWIDKDAPLATMQNKLFESKVVIINSATKDSLADTLINNAGGKIAIAAKTTPDFSYPAPKASSYKDNGFSTANSTASISATLQGKYVTYADAYTFDTTTGLYSLTNPVTAKYSDVYASLTGKYLASTSIWIIDAFNSSNSGIVSSNTDYIFKCVEAPYSSTASVTFKYNNFVSNRFSFSSYVSTDEASSGMWSVPDDYGTSYYYRGAVTNNNVLFGGYCWQVIRINGNGTTRMIYNGTPKDIVTGSTALTQAEYLNVTNDTTYPYTYDTETNQWTSTNHTDSATGTITFQVGTAGNYMFYYTISSEDDVDKATLYVDNVSKGEFSGEQTSSLLLTGLTTSSVIKVTYIKDESDSSGNDNIIFSLGKNPVVSGKTCANTKADTQIGTSAFNTNYTDNAYVGYMYGTVGSSTYAATHANTNSSTIKTAIDTWYNTNLSSYASKISDTEFCNDRSIASAATTWYSNDTALGYGTNITYYGAYNRLVTNKSPILTCPNKNDRFTVDDTTTGNGDLTYPVSLITADEVAVAGGNLNTSNSAYYLYTDSEYWAVSADNLNNSVILGAIAYIVGGPTSFAGTIVNNSDIGVRPVINLNSNVAYSSGDGTITNPYVVE
jgi:hypothetical protein